MGARLAADAGHLHLGEVRCGGGAQLGVAVVPASPERAKERRDLRVRLAAAEQGAQIVAAGGKQAGVQPAVGGEAGGGGGGPPGGANVAGAPAVGVPHVQNLDEAQYLPPLAEVRAIWSTVWSLTPR